MIPADTSERAYAVFTAIHRSLTPAQRFQAAVEMSDFAHKLAEAGLRHREPECPTYELPRKLAELLYERELSTS